jgi:hypothetical protein
MATEQWYWGPAGDQEMVLYARLPHRPVVLFARPGRRGPCLDTCDRTTGRLVPLTPNSLVARLIAATPELAELLSEARNFIFENTEDGRKDVKDLFSRIDDVLHGLNAPEPTERDGQWVEQ